MAAKPDNTKRINTKALRALHALERALNRHADDLMEIDCEDHDVSAAIVYALELNENALMKTRDTKRAICGGSTPADQHDQRAGRTIL